MGPTSLLFLLSEVTCHMVAYMFPSPTKNEGQY